MGTVDDSVTTNTKHQNTKAYNMVKGENGTMDRWQNRTTEKKYAPAETLGPDGGPLTPKSAPGAAGGPSGKLTAGLVQGFQLLQEQGRSRRRRSTCRGRDDGHGLALWHGLPLTESVLGAAEGTDTRGCGGTPTQHAACTCGV